MSNKAYTPSVPHSNAYYFFIAVLTIFSLVIMVLLLLPLGEATVELLLFYDLLICAIFLVDFFNNLFKASSKKAYFVNDRGWPCFFSPSSCPQWNSSSAETRGQGDAKSG